MWEWELVSRTGLQCQFSVPDSFLRLQDTGRRTRLPTLQRGRSRPRAHAGRVSVDGRPPPLSQY